MKPNFALTLSFDGIGLLHRGADGWRSVGDVTLDSADLSAALADLRARAEQIAPDGITSKLIIPNEQIKYLDLDAPDGSDPEAIVRAALDGATPYAVDDLAYDWSAQDGRIHVAAVARETLAEAEAFAGEHAFAPVSFAAIPGDVAFGGEPFFGATRQAAQHLPEGSAVTRDEAPIAVVGRAVIPTPAPDVPEPDAPEPEATEAETPDAPETPAVTDTNDAPPEATTEPEPEAKPKKKKKKKKAKPAVEEAASDDATGPDMPAPKAEPTPEPETPEPKPDAEAAPETAPAAFASIRAQRDVPPGKAPRLEGQPRLSRLDGADTSAPAAAPKLTATPIDTAEADTPAPPLPSPGGGEPLTPPPRVAEIAASLRPDPETRLDVDAQTSAPASPADTPAETATPATPARALSFFSRRKAPKQDTGATAGKRRKAAVSPAEADQREDEKQRMTVFGARQHEVGGKPRFLGLILTAVLLLFLVGVAAWASIFLDDGLSRLFGPPDEIHLADVPEVEGVEGDDPVADAPPLDDTASVDTAALTPEITPLPETAPQSDIAALPDLPEALSPSEAMARYAATGIWQMAPQSPTTPDAQGALDGLYQVSLDPDVARPALPGDISPRAGARSDTRPETPADPPPAGVVFDFDANGFVRATPDGALTPQGVRVFAGRPALTPPADMQQSTPALTPEPGALAQDNAAAGTETAGPDVDPALAALRPRARPGDLNEAADSPADESTAAEAEDAQEATEAGDPALAALRPRLRPDSVAAQAATLRTQTDDTGAPLVDSSAVENALAAASTANLDPDSETADAAQGAADQTAFDDALPQAVSASLVPLKRPSNFAAIVKQSRDETAAQPVSAQQALRPSLPSSASVAKQATEKNAINLRKVNLIGVYGTPASRRALVRLGNGRYKKVQVGDRLDGGQVAAIGDSELRYTKRGRSVILTMPKG